MSNILLVIVLVFVSLPLHGREFLFKQNLHYKKVQIDGELYQVVEASRVDVSQYKELFVRRAYYNNFKGKLKTKIHIVLTNEGEVVRDTELIQKALFTKNYSQLTNRELNKVTAPLYQIIKRIDQVIKEIDVNNKKVYFTTLKPLLYLIHSDHQQDGIDLSSLNYKKLDRLTKLFLTKPIKGFKVILVEILEKSKKLCQTNINELVKRKKSIVSYEEALEIEKRRLGLAYGFATANYIDDYSVDFIDDFELSESISKKLIKEYRSHSPMLKLKLIQPKSFLTLVKKFFQKTYGEQEAFLEYLLYVDDGQNQFVKDVDDFKSIAQISAEYFPYFKANYSYYPIPQKLKTKYKKVLFYDNFSEKLERWELFGPNKPLIKNKTLLTNGNDWYFSGVSSKILFNPYSGDIHIQAIVKIGDGKGSFGFGEKRLGGHGEQGVTPLIGFLFNGDVEGSGSVDFIINNEVVKTFSPVTLDLTKVHKLRLSLYKENGVGFFIDDKNIFHHSFKSKIFGSESVILSSVSEDHVWKEVLVYH